jgi:aspartate-semialdehyde dehydrogenase
MKVCVVGAGAVGKEMIKLLKQRNFPVDGKPTLLARRERIETIDGEDYEVKTTTVEAFADFDIALFAGTEGSKGASQVFGWEAVKQGCVVVDNGDDFRMDPRVPLVVPEVNPEALKDHQGFIANPNCSTIIAMMALAPIHKAAGIDRVVACTYQSVSGSGAAAMDELAEQAKAWAEGRTVEPSVYPVPIAFNVIAQIGGCKDVPGVTSEELKLKRETHKILGDDTIRVSTTCVRVPVFIGHAEALHLELRNPLSVEEARAALEAAPGVRVVDDLDNAKFPTPLDAAGIEDVLVGRIRKDDSVENGLSLFVAGDNLWKGAALNTVQIAEKIAEMTE